MLFYPVIHTPFKKMGEKWAKERTNNIAFKATGTTEDPVAAI